MVHIQILGNEITVISGDSWRGLESSLQTLILADNSISNLPHNAFSMLPKLTTLDLRGNHLSHIDTNVFRFGMERLSKVCPFYLFDFQNLKNLFLYIMFLIAKK